jgi:nucleoid DNA-binding protein
MTNRKFIDQMAASLNTDADILQTQVGDFIDIFLSQIKEGKSIAVKGFGVFEPKEKATRKVYNPTTRTFNVIPAKATIGFKTSAQLKDATNN